jgi:HEAT repeat protein
MARRDPVSDNRNQAIYGLATIGRPAVVPALIDTLADEDADRRDDGRTALYRVLGAEMLPLVADEDEPDEGERDRVAAWWSANAARFDPSRVFAFGELASPGVLVNQLKANNTWPPDAYLNALHDSTGQDFGESPRSKVVRAWEQWWAANRGSYEAGRRYFFGRPVP